MRTYWKKSKRNDAPRQREKGSALLVSLMIMVGLSLLGLAFVAFSETESAISVNERNSAQTLAVAEAGARTVVEWFQSPKWALSNGLMPKNDDAIKVERKTTLPGGVAYTGRYKPAALRLFDLPHKPSANDRFFGIDENSADVVINATTLAASSDTAVKTFLTTFNQRLFNDTTTGGEITDIRIYAPPMINTTGSFEHPAGSGKRFWIGGKRLGLATIKVTAQKKNPLGQVISERFVKIVISEFPFPGPEGPLQSNTGINLTGAFRVHWGKEVSMGVIEQKRAQDGIPWWDAYNQVPFEYGYDDGTNGNDAGTFLPVAGVASKRPFLYDLIGRTFQDPWFHIRARGPITVQVPGAASPPDATSPALYPYDSIDDIENGNNGDPNTGGWSGWFQFQDTSNGTTKKEVVFPRIDYNFWKQIALAGNAGQGIHYLKWVSGTTFEDKNGTQKTFVQWADINSGAKPGFYFFDTRDGTNPQNPDGTTDTAKLTPEIDVGNTSACFRGFIYLNTEGFGIKGGNGCQGWYAAPGEPFRDVGYHEVDETTGDEIMISGAPKISDSARGNSKWDFQDLASSNNNGGKNKVFDYVVAQRATQPTEGADVPDLTNQYFIVPYFNDCNPGVNCSEPHEPYLNLLYPEEFAQAGGGAGTPNTFTVRWEAGTGTRVPKVLASNGTDRITCSATSSIEDCTSNGYDFMGALLRLGSQATDAPTIDGVLFNEGAFFANGGGIYYGSIIVRGAAEKNGNVDVWFDERLVKGNWQERFTEMPRVLITTFETQ